MVAPPVSEELVIVEQTLLAQHALRVSAIARALSQSVLPESEQATLQIRRRIRRRLPPERAVADAQVRVELGARVRAPLEREQAQVVHAYLAVEEFVCAAQMLLQLRLRAELEQVLARLAAQRAVVQLQLVESGSHIGVLEEQRARHRLRLAALLLDAYRVLDALEAAPPRADRIPALYRSGKIHLQETKQVM